MMIDRKICLKYITTVFALFIFTANTFSQGYNEVIDRYISQYPQERVYLHYDKSIYSAGETIWFKAYLRDGFEAANFSKSMYVDFSDETGKVLAHSMFPIGESSSRGQFEIPKTYSGTVIQVRAYTKWMLNFDTAFLYKKTIKVIPKGNSNIFIRPQKLNVTANFFPEGGELVNGIESKVAFLATDQYGKPVDLAGKVTNNSGKKIADIVTEHNGMGLFVMTPVAGESYKVEWTATEGNSGTYNLPKALEQGVSLSVSPQLSGAVYTITRSEQASEAAKKVSIIGMMYNRLVYMANINLTDKKNAEGSIPYKELPAGILQLTILDADKKPLSERIVFVNNSDYTFPIEVGLTKLGLGKRQENELSVHLPEQNTLSNLSVSVTDAGINTDATENIYSNLLLTSQIKGRVYNPSYYFSEDFTKTFTHLDLVMLTQGWRRYDWGKIARSEPIEIKHAPDTGYLHFNGKVFATQQQIAAGGDMVAILRVKGDTSQAGNSFIAMPINKDGTFEDRNISFMDSITVFYSYSNKNSPLRYSEVRFLEDKVTAPVKIEMDSRDVLATKSVDSSGFGRDKYFSTLNFTAQEEGDLKDVVVTTQAKTEIQKLDERYASGLFKGDAYQFDLINDPFASSSMTIFQYLQSRVPGLQISNAQSTQPSLSWRGSEPSLFLDEMPTQVDFLSSVNVSDVAYIKVFRPPFFGAMGGGAGGGIAVYTKRGGDVQTTKSGGGIPSKVIEGYTLMKEFYSPNYITLDPRHENQDLRSTIYWNPIILLDNNGRTAKFKFYNNDVTTSFRIILEGVNADGKLVRIEKVVQ